MEKKVIKPAIKKGLTSKEKSVETKLLENFVSLQRVMVNLSEKFDGLSNNISKLLELFELSATALAKKDINFTKPMDEEKIIGKLNHILDQNKTIARGLALMSEGVGGNIPEKTTQIAIPQFRQSPVPSSTTKGEYQKSPFKGF